MDFLDEIFYHNTVEKWLIAAAVVTAVWLAFLIVKKILYRKIKAFSRKTATRMDDLIVLLIHKIKMGFSFFVALYAGSLVLTLPPRLSVILGKLAVLAILLQGAVWGTEIIAFWLGRSSEKKDEGDAAGATTMAFLNFIIRLGLWTIVVFLALDNIGVKVTTLIAGLGVGGVAVALAVQNILGDLFASLSIILDKPFVIGDFVVVDGFRGSIEYVGLKTTRIRSLSGEQIVFANSDLLKSRISNYKRMIERRIAFSIGVVYQTNREKLAALPGLIKEIIEAQPNTRFDRAHFKAFGNFSLDFEIVYWVTTPDYTLYMDIQQAINLALFKRFQDEGIEFAYPTQTLFLERGETEDRS